MDEALVLFHVEVKSSFAEWIGRRLERGRCCWGWSRSGPESLDLSFRGEGALQTLQV